VAQTHGAERYNCFSSDAFDGAVDLSKPRTAP